MKVTCLLLDTCDIISFVNVALFWYYSVRICSPPSVEWVNEWMCTSATPIQLHGVDRHNVTFTLMSYFCFRSFVKRLKLDIIKTLDWVLCRM
jgi:hypothetical protein